MEWYEVLIYKLSTKKLPFIPILTWFLVLGKIQDGNHCWWRHKPPAAPPSIKYTFSCWENQRLSTYGKIVSKYCNISKTLGRDSIHPPPRYHGGDMNLLVRPRVILGINNGCFAVSPWLKHVLQTRCNDHECMYFYHIAPAWSNMKSRKLITFQTFL